MKEDILGFSNIREELVRCGDCGAPLVNIVVTETNDNREIRQLKPIVNRFKVVECYRCNGNSFTTDPIEGTFAIGTTSDDLTFDVIDTDIEPDGTIFSTLKVSVR